MNELIFKPVFIFSPGRSGSTLLQRYLNLSDELVLWGEHGGLIRDLIEVYTKFLDNAPAQRNIKSGYRNIDVMLNSTPIIKHRIEWTNNFTNDDLVFAIRDLITTLFTKGINENQRWGFKEIRYFEEEIEFLQRIFPECQIVIIIRDPLDTVISMIGAWDKIRWKKNHFFGLVRMRIVRKFCKRIIRALTAYTQTLNELKSAKIVRYEDLIGNPHDSLLILFEHLNLKFPGVEKINLIANSVLDSTEKEKIKADIMDVYIKTRVFKKMILQYEKLIEMI